jgi:hypothetical protein
MELDWTDFFAGAVPPLAILDVEIFNLRFVSDKMEGGVRNPAPEVCLIALVAYFEGFCKNHFAALLNICPRLLRDFHARGRPVEVNACHLLDLDGSILEKIGFLIADRFDFGTAQTINALYLDLLKVTPFSKNEAKRFGEILDDRNALVHHGGIVGLRYPRERFIRRETGRNRLFLDSLDVTKDQFETAADFLFGVARKTAAATKSALITYVSDNQIQLFSSAGKALDMLTMD